MGEYYENKIDNCKNKVFAGDVLEEANIHNLTSQYKTFNNDLINLQKEPGYMVIQPEKKKVLDNKVQTVQQEVGNITKNVIKGRIANINETLTSSI